MARNERTHNTTAGRQRLAALLAAAALLVLLVPVALGAGQARPGQRIDLKVLLIAPTANDAVTAAWRSALDGEGVPSDVRVLNAGTPDLTDGDLADYGANRAYYQAVIVASFDKEMAAGEAAALNKLQATFGIRRLVDNMTPGPELGLSSGTAGEQGGPGKTAQLTDAGKALFPYLQGTVPIDEFAFGYQATPATPAFTTLLSGPNGSAYLGILKRGDGQEDMVSMLTGGRFQTHHQLLRHGVITWLTGGVFLGYQRNHFEMQVDDIFLPNDRWDVNEHKTGVDEPTSAPDEYQCDRDPETPIRDCLDAIRMQPADVTKAVQWQNANGVKLDMVFNGGGSDEQVRETGSDPLAAAFLGAKSAFRWINHTYSHPKLDPASRSTIVHEVGANVRWAADHGLAIDPAELVTGEHSGLNNPDMPGALADLGIGWIASDNSRESSQRAIGPATTVPRYPSNVYYNVGTKDEQLDEYNWIYVKPPLGKCVNVPNVTTCRDTKATWEEYIKSEADIMFDHVMDNDPRPHYAHQSNLTLEKPEDGQPVLYQVMDAVLARYRPYVKVPIVQLSHTGIGQDMQRRARWNADRGGISAYLQDGMVNIRNTTPRAVPVPLTGTAIGDLYGGQRSGWITVDPEETRQIPRGGPPPGGKPPVRVTLKNLKIKPKRFAVTGKRAGARVSWTVSHASTLRLTVERSSAGRKVGRACRAPSKRTRKRRPCRRFVAVGGITVRARAGAGSVKFTGKVGGRRLRRGAYRLSATAKAAEASAGTSAPGRVTFAVVKARRR